MSENLYWYRVEYVKYTGEPGAPNKLHVSRVHVTYVCTREKASLLQIRNAIWHQLGMPISPEVFVHIRGYELVERVGDNDERNVASYIGVKMIDAWPEERNGQPGYGVKYPDGYTSWSPKDTFESAYFKVDPQMSNSELHDHLEDTLDTKIINFHEVWRIITKWAVQGLTNTR